MLFVVAPCSALAIADDGDSDAEEAETVVQLDTNDGAQLVATFWPGEQKKETIPVMLIHGDRGNRREFEGLGRYLHKQGFAVLAPDLRGHGDSTHFRGTDLKLDAVNGKMPLPQYAMVGAIDGDLDRCKKFLFAKHNEGQLNIEKLCLVGSELGGLMAMQFAVNDWNWPPLVGLANGKQGQDVRAIVLLSPPDIGKGAILLMPGDKENGARIADMLGADSLQNGIGFLIAMGSDDPKALRDGRQMYKSLDRYRRRATEARDKTIFIDESLKTKLQGTKLLGQGLGLEQRIAEFFRLRMTYQVHSPWKERKKPI